MDRSDAAPLPWGKIVARLAFLLVAQTILLLVSGKLFAAEVTVYQSVSPPEGLELKGPPSLAGAIAAGKLPAIDERLPTPALYTPASDERTVGRYGGALRTLVTRSKDTRLLMVYGYARLIAYNQDLELVPDILSKVEVEDGRIFTLYLRKGHRWSDGHPFTTEDFRYYWLEVANNEELAPSGPPISMKVDGVAATVEVIDETTIRYSWPGPNPFFLPSLAGAAPLLIYRPAHYMKQFHMKFGDPAQIEEAVNDAGVRNWAHLHNRLDNLYKFDNPDLPTLQPWMNTTAPPSTRIIGKRNPYFHRVDAEGQQLPYLDKFILTVVGGSLVPAKTGAGESDLQARGLNFTDYTFLKESEERSAFSVRLWRTVRGSQLALYPNLNATDPVWRELMRDVRFRRALSMAIDRDEINAVIYYGLCLPGNNFVLPDSPLFDEELHAAWTGFDLDAANELLDEIGLTERNDDDVRLLPNGEPLEIVVETAGENTEEVDVLELIRDSWALAGIKLFTKPSQREVLRNRVFAGEAKMVIWFGYENGVPTADMSPEEFVPVHQSSFQWPKWGQYYETSGFSGEAVDMPLAKELLVLYHRWMRSRSTGEREEIWHRILEIHSDQLYTIGLVAEVPQPVVVSNTLMNVPLEGIFNWDPGANFGIYRPDTFWFEE